MVALGSKQMKIDNEDVLMDHLKVLCESIGPRPGGSSGNLSAAEYIREQFEFAGWEVEEQQFDCPDWRHKETALILEGNALTALANAYSPACDVEGPIMSFCTIPELEAAELDSRVAVLYGELTKSPISPKSWFLKSERDDRLIHVLESSKPLAVLTVQAGPFALESVFEDWEYTIPSATVPPEVGLALRNNETKNVHLSIDAELHPSHTANIVARSAGAQNKVVVCAHYDTKFGTPGAIDNGSGVAILLALAQLLDPEVYPFQLEFVAFANEEYMPIGDDEYLRRRENRLDDVILAINIDLVGQALSSNSIAAFEISKGFKSEVEDLVTRYPGLVWVPPWPESNHSTFAMRGVPSIAFSADGGVRLQHGPDDVIKWLDLSKLKEVVEIISELLDLVSVNSPDWTRIDHGSEAHYQTLR
jgi:aminopeptidase YwaD